MAENIEETLGRRIARLRNKLALTQQELAERLGLSRVAISHMEAGMTTPGERTVTLLAGLFKVEPHELVAGTSYPTAKSERLPLVACRYTEAEMQLALLESDMAWIQATGSDGMEILIGIWVQRIDQLLQVSVDHKESQSLRDALRALRKIRDGAAAS